MIAFLKGRLVHKEPAFVILETNGIGYQVLISLNTYAQLKDQEALTLQTVLVVREDAHLLYGFFNAAEKQMFQSLVSVNGIGPGTALLVLSSLSPEDLREAILTEDIRTLQSVKGIGGKTAQRMVLELKDKMRRDGMDISSGGATVGHNKLRSEALSALTTLGIPKPAAEKSVDSILKKHGNNISLEELVKLALKTA